MHGPLAGLTNESGVEPFETGQKLEADQKGKNACRPKAAPRVW
jgi:hypothetical protein